MTVRCVDLVRNLARKRNSECPVSRGAWMRRRRGMSLLEVLVGVMVLGIAVVGCTTMFSTTHLLRDRSGYYSRAAGIAQQKLEQIRQYASADLQYNTLRAAQVIDTSTNPSTAIYSFTTANSLNTQLPGGTGTLQITNGTSDLVRIDVTVGWKGLRGRSEAVTTTTYVPMLTAWRVP